MSLLQHRHSSPKRRGGRKDVTLILGFLGVVLGVVIWAKHTIEYTTVPSDFSQDYGAAQALRQGQPIYGDPVEDLIQDSLGWHYDNYHPPTVAVLMVPFSCLSYPAAVITFNILNLFLYVGLIAWLAMRYRIESKTINLLGALLLLWFPFISNIALVQLSLLLAVLIILSLHLLERGRNVSAGVALSVAAAIKLFPAYIALYFVLKRKWRALTAFSMSLSLIWLATWGIVGTDNVADYVLTYAPENAEKWVAFPLNHSIFSVVATLLAEGPWTSSLETVWWYREAYILIGIMISAWLVGLSMNSLESEATKQDLAMLVMVAMLLLSPITWNHAMTLLLAPVFLLLSLGLQRERIVALVVLLLCAIPDVHVGRFIYQTFSPERIPGEVVVLSKFSFFALCLLFWIFSQRLLEARRQPRETNSAAGRV